MSPAIFATGVAIAVALLLLPRVLGRGADDLDGARLAAYFAAGIALFVVWHCDRVMIVVTKDSFAAGFRLLRTVVPLADLVRVERDDARLLDLRGAVRRGPAWTYTARTGPAIFVSRRGGLDLLITCTDPDSVFTALRAAGVSEAKLFPAGRITDAASEERPA